MANDTIFFSYSRADSEFVINLAKNLREAGATIWLDQLDIRPGTRWDRSIEKALQDANTLLIILSKNSVDSHNVMDEVSFALEEGKNVVPVLLEECKIPFRLRRLQFADFSKDQAKGIATLIDALDLDRTIASKLSNVAAKTDIKSETADVKAKVPPVSSKPKSAVKAPVKADPGTKAPEKKSLAKEPKKKKKSKWPYVVIPLILLLAAAGYYFKDDLMPPKTDQAWQNAQNVDNRQAYQTYIDNNPDGRHVIAAKDSIRSKDYQDAKLASENDKLEWQKALDQNTIEGYNAYINKKRSPKNFITEANNKKDSLTALLIENIDTENELERAALLDSLKQQDSLDPKLLTDPKTELVKEKAEPETNPEEEAWEAAKSANTFDGYIDFLMSSDNQGTYAGEVESKLRSLGRSGWLFCGMTSDNQIYSGRQVARTIWRNNSSGNLDQMVPQNGDIVVNIKQTLNTYPVYSPRDNSNGVWRINLNAYVSDIRMDGRAIYLKVIYSR